MFGPAADGRKLRDHPDWCDELTVGVTAIAQPEPRMPHLVILYSENLDAQANMSALCRSLADTLLAQTDEAGAPVFPPGGTRVLAYPAPRFAIADGQHDCAFAYLNLRIGRGRDEAAHRRIGEALVATARAFFEPIQVRRLVGVTLQIDVGAEVFNAKLGNIHALYDKPD
jgi:5-carboxymethyl-2-hydroxymuconate isomerase